jgi:lipopolysaccharide/colanic/teichoic acid biosynthesis glycosyltransferase
MLGNYRPPERRPRARARVDKFTTDVPVRVPVYLLYKRFLDLALAVFLAIILGPVVAVVAALIRLTSRGPAFYRQIRLGRSGKPFAIWKLRTMEHNCEQQSGVRWSIPGDRRITPIGRVLRRLHIDEFPQLWNVLRGDMSLVGPRPERPEFFPVLSAAIPSYAQRLFVKPGVTGLAQVFLPADEDVEGVGRKQVHDLYYIRHVSLFLDLRLMVATALQAVGVPHAVVRPLLWLPSLPAIEGPIAERSPVPEPRPELVRPVLAPPISQTVS